MPTLPPTPNARQHPLQQEKKRFRGAVSEALFAQRRRHIDDMRVAEERGGPTEREDYADRLRAKAEGRGEGSTPPHREGEGERDAGGGGDGRAGCGVQAAGRGKGPRGVVMVVVGGQWGWGGRGGGRKEER